MSSVSADTVRMRIIPSRYASLIWSTCSMSFPCRMRASTSALDTGAGTTAIRTSSLRLDLWQIVLPAALDPLLEMRPLRTDCGRLTVPRIDPSRVREHEELGANTVDDLIET